MNIRNSKAFALPTVLISSVIMLIVMLSAVTSAVATQVSLNSQYYDRLAQAASDAGVAYAKACLTKSNGLPQWSDSKPLKPNTDCSGDQLSGFTCVENSTDQRCSLAIVANNITSSFSVPLPVVNITGSSFQISAKGNVDLHKSDNSTWRSYAAQSSFQLPRSTRIVTFNSNGGSVVSPSAVTFNTIVSTPTAPTRSGYIFNGWYKDASLTNVWNFASDLVNADLTLYAKWTVGCLVSFNSNGGSAVSSINATCNALITSPAAPTRTGYTFGGWYKEASLTNVWNFASDLVTSSVTLYAKWTANNYTVTFNSNGGSAVSSKVAAYNTTITAPTAPTKTCNSLLGWYKEASLTNAWSWTTDRVTSNITLYAKWSNSALGGHTWAEIKTISDAGQGDVCFDVGDEITVNLGTYGNVIFKIYGFSHDDKTSGGKAGITFGLKSQITTSSQMGYYETSPLRAWMASTLYQSFPADLKSQISPVYKSTWYRAGDNFDYLVKESYNLFLFASDEYYSTGLDGHAGEGSQYQIFAQNKLIMSGWSRTTSTYIVYQFFFTGTNAPSDNPNGLGAWTSNNQTMPIMFGFSI